MKRLLSILLATCGLVVAFSCSDPSPLAGGTGTGTDNTVARTLSISIDSAMDSLQGSSNAPVPLLVRLDSSNFKFDGVREDGSDLKPSFADGRPVPFFLRDWSKAARRASLWVRLDSFRRGTTERLKLSWGDSDAVATSDPVGTWRGIADSVRLRRASLLVTDFESGTGDVPLPCRCNTFYAGEKEAGALLLPLTHTKLDSAIEPAGGGRAGKALHVVYSATGANYGLIGTRLGKGLNRFGGLDSLVLWLRGTGTVKVALENGLDTVGGAKAWINILPDSSWRRYAIKPTDFNAPTASARGWNAIKDSVNTLSFFFHEGGEMWIDDIRLHGLTGSDIP